MAINRSSLDAFVGVELAGFRILRVLGAGAMGAVFEADASAHGWPTVALKILAPHLTGESSLRARFVREGRAQQQLAHPNVLPVFDAGESDGVAYIAMELAPHGSLGQRLENGAMPEADARLVFRDILSGLWHAHSSGFVHRDIKPDNVLFRADGSAALADFGIVGELGGTESHHLTQTGAILGTPAYMSPESCSGEKVDQRSDLYAVGCMMFQALTGQLVFRAKSASLLLLAHIQQAPSPPSSVIGGVSEDMDAIVLRLLEKKPKSRFPTAEEVLRVLNEGYLDDPVQGTRFRKQFESAMQLSGSTVTPPTMADEVPRTLVPPPARSRPRSGRTARPAMQAPVTTRTAVPAWLIGLSVLLAVAAVAMGVLWQSAEGARQVAGRQLEQATAGNDELASLVDASVREATDAAQRLELATRQARALRAALDLTANGLAAELLADHVAAESTNTTSWLDPDRAARFRHALEAAIVAADSDQPPSADCCLAIAVLQLAVAEPQFDDVIATLDRGIGFWPHDVRFRLQRGQVHVRLRQFDAARVDFDEAIRLADDDYRGWLGRSGVWRNPRDHDRQIADLTEAIQRSPGNGDLRVKRASARIDLYHASMEDGAPRTNELELAGRELDEAVKADPENVSVWTMRGVYHQLRREFDQALNDYDTATRLDPERATAWYHRGMTLFYMERIEDAIESMSRAIDASPSYYAAFTNRASFRLKIGDLEGAARDFRAALALGKNPAERWIMLTNLGQIHAQLGQRAQALESLDRALAICPEDQRETVRNLRRRISGE